jgi:hypothetical protein
VKRTLLLCLALGALPALGEEHIRQAPVAAPITLYSQFQREAAPAVVDALKKELDKIMNPIGLSFDWRAIPRVNGNEVSVELAVITFKGRCDTGDLTSDRFNPGALGWTHMSDGMILPFSDVDCDRIRAFVQHDLLGVRPEARDKTFGRALARVLAHELYHIFANTTKHGSCGVGKGAYSVQELLENEFQFETAESDALRSSKAHVALETAAGTM